MKILEKIIAVVVSIINDPKTALKELKEYGRVFSARSAPYIFTALLGVLFTLCGFRYAQNQPGYIPNSYEEIVEETVETVQEETTETAENANIRMEAEYCAKVLYGTARNNTEAGQKLVVWCIINRVENTNYPNTVREVCQQSQQWMGYDDGNPILTNLFDISLEVLQQWHSGAYRDVSPDYIYMTWSSKEIILKDTFEDNSRTHYWGE